MKTQVRKQASQKKYLHPLGHDCSTTSDFGFLQPIFGRELSPQDSLKIRNGSIVRLQPLVKPTFANLTIREYTAFVPYESVYHPFGSLLDAKSYRGAGDAYIPTKVPSMSERYWRELVCMFSTAYVWKVTRVSGNTSGSWNGKWSQLELPAGSSGSSAQQTAVISAVLEDYFKHFGLANNSLYDLWSYCKTKGYGHQAILDDYTIKRTRDAVTSFILPTACDFVDSWEYTPEGGTAQMYLVGFKLSRFGKNIRKVHLGVGNQLSTANQSFSLLPFFCFYKMWFDLFQPARDMTWKDTICHQILENIEQFNLHMEDVLDDTTLGPIFMDFMYEVGHCYYTQNPDYISAHITGQAVTQSSDVSRKYMDGVGTIGTIGNDELDQSNGVYPTSMGLNDGQDAQEGLTSNALGILRQLTRLRNISTAIGGRIADSLRSIWDSAYLDENTSNFIGSHVYDVQISDVMSMAETSEGYLGEYAGQGRGGSKGKDLKFKAPSFGCVITMVAVVPDAKYAQGVDPLNYHVFKDDFFNAMFDASTLVASPKTILFGAHDIYNLEGGSTYGRNWNAGSFGNIPVYSEYCQARNVINGDMSLMSKRNTYLPFNMDKLLPYDYVDVKPTEVSGTTYYKGELVTSVTPAICTAGSIWRYIGRDRWNGEFDRIFVNSGEYTIDSLSSDFQNFDDNFILHFYLDMSITGYKLPMSLSFDTSDTKDTMTVQKA